MSYSQTTESKHLNDTCTGFTPDVKIWEVSGTPGELKVTRAMELKGHNSGVSNFSFNGDSSRLDVCVFVFVYVCERDRAMKS